MRIRRSLFRSRLAAAQDLSESLLELLRETGPLDRALNTFNIPLLFNASYDLVFDMCQ